MTPTPLVTDAYVDAEGAWRDYVNTLAGDLVGTGFPLARGAFLKRLRSPAKGAYAYLMDIGGDDQWTDYGTTSRRISAQIFGNTKAQAADAAIAYANTLRRTRRVQLVPGVFLHTVAGITGPLYTPDADEERYLVDADLYVQPTSTP